jgi:hypothetical protein
MDSAGERLGDCRIAGQMQVVVPWVRAPACPVQCGVTGGPRHCGPVFVQCVERVVSILPVPGKDSIRTLGFFQVCVLYQPKGTTEFSGKDIQAN